MSLIGITGATGHLGRLTVEALLDAGVEPSDIVAIVREPARAGDLAERGVQVRQADYSDPSTLPAALAGIENLLLVSGNEMGQRVAQHTAVIDAAKAAGVRRVVYTSAPRADVSELLVAPEHRATEQALIGSGLDHTILRNNWYFENYTAQLPQYLEHGVVLGATEGKRIAAAARADYAAAAAAVLTQNGHAGAIYELAGDGFTLDELAAAITEISGTTVVHRDVSGPDPVAALQAAGLDAGTAQFVAAIDAGIARGELEGDPADLARLIGRPPVPLADAIRAAL